MLLKNVLHTVQTVEVAKGNGFETIRLMPQEIREFSADELRASDVAIGIQNGNLMAAKARKPKNSPAEQVSKKGGE